MKIADISVSRVHSFIRIMGNKIVVEDNGSKFGTLVKIFNPSQILSLQDQNGENYKTRYKYNSKIFQVGRTMFYFKFFDQESKLINKDQNLQLFPADLKIDPNSEDLSYVALKGTTFKRKTMLEHKLEYIPREFAPNELPFQGSEPVNSGEDNGPDSDSGNDNSDISDRPKATQKPSLRHSVEGLQRQGQRQSVDRELNNDSSKIFIQNQLKDSHNMIKVLNPYKDVTVNNNEDIAESYHGSAK